MENSIENMDQVNAQGLSSQNTQQQTTQIGPGCGVVQQQQQQAGDHANASQITSSQQQQQQPFDTNLPKPYVAIPPSSANPFDFSSYDHLQAHALQLTVSAGLALPNQQGTIAAPPSSDSTAGQNNNPSQQMQTQLQPQHQYYYVQNPTTNALQVILASSSSSLQPPHALIGQAPAVFPQKYITTGATQAPIPVPNNYGDLSMFATAGNQPTAAQTMMQSVLNQSYIAGGMTGQETLLPGSQSRGGRGMTAGAAAAMALAARESNAVTPSVVSSSSKSGTNASSMLSRAIIMDSSSSNMGSCSGGSSNNNNNWKKAPAQASSASVEEPLNPNEEEKRRHERNQREQQRSLKISQQIQQLRDLLTDSGIPFKPNKFSILYSVAEYIKQLQARAIMLDVEHRKLVETIRQTNDMETSGDAQTSGNESMMDEKKGSNLSRESELLFVQGLDYQAIFAQCPAALGVAALDGRLLACNDEFENVLGAGREELLNKSLFNLMHNHQDVFRAMGEMLKSAGLQSNLPPSETPQMYWSGCILSQKDQNLYMTITLTKDSGGMPKFFNCALANL